MSDMKLSKQLLKNCKNYNDMQQSKTYYIKWIVFQFPYLVYTHYTFSPDAEANRHTVQKRGHKLFLPTCPERRSRNAGSRGGCSCWGCTYEACTDCTEGQLHQLCKDTVLWICHKAQSHLLYLPYRSYMADRQRNDLPALCGSHLGIRRIVFLRYLVYRHTALSSRRTQFRKTTPRRYIHKPYNPLHPARRSCPRRCHSEALSLVLYNCTARREGCRIGSLSHGCCTNKAHIHLH